MISSPNRRKILTQAGALPFVGLAAGRAYAQTAPAANGLSLNEKSARRQATDEQILSAADDKTAQSVIIDDFFKADYGATPAGRFLNPEKLFLRWAKPDWFEYLPDPQNPL